MKKFIKIFLVFIIFIGVGFSIYLFSFSGKETKKENDNEIVEETDEKIFQFEPIKVETKISLVMVGDALIHSALYDDARKDGTFDFKSKIAEFKPIISSFDLAYYNQETILGGEEIGLSTYPRFNSPYDVGDAFLDAGFNLISLANNHTLDRGVIALENSCNYWKDKDVYTAGSYCSQEDRDYIKIGEKNGITYAMLSYTTTTNGIRIPNNNTYYVNVYDPEVVKQDIEKYRDKVDLLMVAMHWGSEYTHTPTTQEKTIANYLAGLGVDIVIGAHPHVVQPIEMIGNTLVIYSLGNFISAQRGIEKLTGLMASVDITKNFLTGEITLSNVQAELTYTYAKDYGQNRGNFKVYPYTKLNNSLLSNYESYYNKYMNIVIGDSDFISKGDYSGDSK